MTSIQSEQSSTIGINRRTIYTDGGCHNEAGPRQGIGSYAWLEPVDISQGYVDVYGQYTPDSTNNKTEMLAVINGVTFIHNAYPNCNIVHVISDSGYLVNGFTNPSHLQKWISRGWRLSTNEPVKNVPLWERLLSVSWIIGIEWTLIKGHNKDKDTTHAFWNDICDKACTYIMDNLPSDGIRYCLRYEFKSKSMKVINMEVV